MMCCYAALEEYFRLTQTRVSSSLDEVIHDVSCYDNAVTDVENRMWEESVTKWIGLYQQLSREKEVLLKALENDKRHHITIVIPVADRPIHLETCLHSIISLCEIFQYGGYTEGQYEKVSVIVADDSKVQQNIEKHQCLAKRFSDRGLRTCHFGITNQLQLLDKLDAEELASISNVLGANDRSFFYHKGPSVMRNIAYMELTEQKHSKRLFYFVDSDQEFRVNVESTQGEQGLYAINYFAELDRIFTQRNVSVLTGKVVGDPPVSPAVMAGNFLEDVLNYLHDIAHKKARDACQYHGSNLKKRGDAAYHDMAGLFGFESSHEPYGYCCDIVGEHDHLQCFDGFAHKLNQFFYGGHPTRKSFYEYSGTERDVKPARTIYTGNYVFNAEALKYFIPFAGLRLRMAGPVLGRVIKAEIGDKFVSANLPMLHKRTVEQTGQSEFRPGVKEDFHRVDLTAEFERQYYGDVVLFSIEKLTHDGYPECLCDKLLMKQIVESTERSINKQYEAKHAEIMRKLTLLKEIFSDENQWWNQIAELTGARQYFEHFIENVEHNYSSESRSHALVNSKENRTQRLNDIVCSIHAYPTDREAWEAVIARIGSRNQR